MSIKSRPGGWQIPICVGTCLHKVIDTDICVKCFSKKRYENCKDTCQSKECNTCESNTLSNYTSDGGKK